MFTRAAFRNYVTLKSFRRKQELQDIGFDEYAGGEGTPTMIEWRLVPGGPAEAISGRFPIPEGRKIAVAGKRYEEL